MNSSTLNQITGILCVLVIFFTSLVRADTDDDTQVYDIAESAKLSVQFLINGDVLFHISDVPCAVRLPANRSQNALIPHQYSLIVRNAPDYFRFYGQRLQLTLDRQCNLESMSLIYPDEADVTRWAAFVYGSERTTRDGNQVNQIAYGDIASDAAEEATARNSAQLTCETYALQNGMTRDICDTSITIQGGRNACISYQTTSDSSEYGQFIGVASGDSVLSVENEAVSNCVAAVTAAGSDQSCDYYKHTICNNFGHRYRYSSTARFSSPMIDPPNVGRTDYNAPFNHVNNPIGQYSE